jgi:anti-sigma factor RsiW
MTTEHQHHNHDHDSDTCRRYLNSLSDYVDGVLDEELCDELETHMESCENCRIVVNTLSKTIALYHQLPEPELPSAVRARLFKVLDLRPYYKADSD